MRSHMRSCGEAKAKVEPEQCKGCRADPEQTCIEPEPLQRKCAAKVRWIEKAVARWCAWVHAELSPMVESRRAVREHETAH